MKTLVYLSTPPFTQLNTPYPATPYLKGFLNTRGIRSFQADLGIEVTLALFNRAGLTDMFSRVKDPASLSPNSARIYALRERYLAVTDAVMLFLQGKNPTVAHLIAGRKFLPEAARFEQAGGLDWAFGTMGKQDEAKYLATMFLEDLADFIKECIDPHFGFSRYAEKLGRSAASFDELYASLKADPTYIDGILLGILRRQIDETQPDLVALSIPFPGNLYSAFRCAAFLKQHYPHIRIAMGGGYANTELRSVSDPRVFEFTDFITLDDGEAPMENLIAFVRGEGITDRLKRTFMLADGKVTFFNNPAVRDYRQGEVGTPDYSDLPLDRYISAIEVVNPMHSLWSDGLWNKLTMAHGCYWGKCTFCDISLDYIRRFEPLTAALLCDRMETLVQQTGQTGFHFVDEAAPPALMRALALEILRRRLVVSWWTNIRFEKSFTRDLCLLLRASGCIAVSGGLEVASDRLLKLIDKGITVDQVARVNRNLTAAGIMVHAYLMYGFPTQTAQETIDSLEMVRQLFAAGVLQSAFWHQFTMTAHSPVGINPEKYAVKKRSLVTGSFANNDIEHDDPGGADHEKYAFGLKKSLHNFMHALCLADPLQQWFDFKIPKTKVDPGYITRALEMPESAATAPTTKVVWLGTAGEPAFYVKSKGGNSREMMDLPVFGPQETVTISLPAPQGRWLLHKLPELAALEQPVTRQQLVDSYAAEGLEEFDLFWDNKPVNTLYQLGLLQV